MDRLRQLLIFGGYLLALSGTSFPLSASDPLDSLRQRIDYLENQPDSLAALALDWHRLGLAYDDIDDLPQAIDATRQALSFRLDLEKMDPDPVLVSATNLGLYHQKMGRYQQARSYYQLVLDRAPNRKVGQVHYQLGKLFDRLGATVLADQSFRAASALAPFSSDAFNRFFLFLEWGKLYLRDDPGKAISAEPLLRNALLLCDSLGDDADYYRAYTLNRIGLSQIYRGELAMAIATLNEARQINWSCCDDDDLAVNLATNLGIAHRRSGEMQQALGFYQQSLSINQRLSEGTPDAYLANDYNNLSTFYLLNEQPDSACFHARKALFYTLPGLGEGVNQRLPTEAEFATVSDPTALLTFLLDLARAETAAAAVGDTELGISATHTYQSCDVLIDYLYQTQAQQASRLEWRATAREVYEEAVAQALVQDDLKQAIHYSEKSRAQLLLDEQLLARAGAALPTTLSKRLQNLRTAAAYYADLEADSEQFLRANQEYESFRDSLLIEFPAFAVAQDLAQQEIALSDLNLAAFEETLVEYFFAADYALAFIADQGNWRVVELNQQAIEAEVGKYRQELLDYRTTFDPEPAHRLYQLLIEPLNLSINQGLVIVPDGPLQDVPFSAFLTALPIPESAYQTWPWMQQAQSISYAYSLRWLAEQQVAADPGQLLFFGPMSEPRPEHGITEEECLVWTESFSQDLSQLLEPKVLLSTNADRAAFNRLAPQAATLHLSSHAFPSSPDQPSAYFLLADQTDNRYFTHELFQHRLRADLVVLAACETSLGVLNQGEGVASLGRSFAYAGAKSLVTSLWPVDETATNDLLLPYYQALTSTDKATALQTAQRAFLDTQLNNDRAHPYFWSGLIYHGQHQLAKLGKTTRWSNWYLLILVLPLVLASRYLIGRQRTS
ncbi:MAG: CHAT domain-containing tetratricopeptide repeat protein [Bacteroidota bacterium]